MESREGMLISFQYVSANPAYAAAYVESFAMA